MWTTSNPRTWMANCEPAAWTKDSRVHFNVRDENGIWHPFSADPSDPATVKPWLPGLPKQHCGVSDVTPDGKFAVLTLERAQHWPFPVGSPMAEPGKGALCDLWMTDGNQKWQLTTTQQSGMAVIWPCFSPDGNRLTWSTSYHVATVNEIFGYWRINVADIAWTPTPHLVNVKTIEPEANRFYETYGWDTDGDLLFASDMTKAGWWDSQIWTMPEAGLKPTDAVQVSPGDAPVFWQITTDYAEFAKPLPDGSIAFCKGWGASKGGMDHWVQPPKGKYYRLTGQSTKQDAHMAGGFCFSPDYKHMFAGYAYDIRSGRLDGMMFDVAS